MNENTKDNELCTQGHDAASGQGEGMNSSGSTTIGDLVAAVLDEAAYYSADLRRVSHLATQAVARLLWRARSRSPGTDAIENAIQDGCRFPAYGTPVPVAAQIRVAVYAASVVASPAQIEEPL